MLIYAYIKQFLVCQCLSDNSKWVNSVYQYSKKVNMCKIIASRPVNVKLQQVCQYISNISKQVNICQIIATRSIYWSNYSKQVEILVKLNLISFQFKYKNVQYHSCQYTKIFLSVTTFYLSFLPTLCLHRPSTCR